jgi:plastocyanin
MKTVLCLCVVGLFAMKSFATIHVVNVSGLSFSPANITIQQGDTVRWVKTAGVHNVAETSAVPVFRSGDPTGSAFTYNFAFNAPLVGTYSYRCDVHFSSGMVGTVTVQAPPPPCLAPTDLMIVTADGDGNARDFHWTAPQAGTYQIYSTPDATLATSPPGAGWTLEASTFVAAPGPASLQVGGQTEDVLFYVVIQNCAP